jgi:nucleotide-binding universal stress UspA family protein
MTPKDIQLYLTAGGPNARRLAFAALIARDYTARISGLCLVHEPDLPVFDDFAIGPDAVADELTQRDEAIAKLVAPTEAAFRAALTGREVEWDLANVDTIPELLTRAAKLADLSIIGWPPGKGQVERAIAEALLMQNATACLIVPETGEAAAAMDRIIVAWNSSREATRAMIDSLDLLHRAQAVEVLVVDDPNPALCDASALGRLLNHLDHQQIPATRRRIDPTGRNVGKDLLRACDEFGADLLVMGAFGHGRALEHVVGGATAWVLAESRIPILLAH